LWIQAFSLLSVLRFPGFLHDQRLLVASLLVFKQLWILYNIFPAKFKGCGNVEKKTKVLNPPLGLSPWKSSGITV
jgi:hypothetical protein